MELQRLRCFVAAAEESAFRRAARRVGINQGPFSRAIAALEADLGVTLFERHSAGVRLTEVGRAFLTDTRRILADIDRAREAAQMVAHGNGGRLRLAICEDATTPVFGAILAAQREKCPGVVLDLFEMPTAAQAAALRRGEVDVGLLLPPVPSIGLQLDDLWSEPWLLALSEGHPLASKPTIKISDIADVDFITAHPEYGPGCHYQAAELFRAAGVEPRIVARAFNRTTMLILVRSGMGVTLVPGSFARNSLDGVILRELDPDAPTMRVMAAYPEGDMQGTVARFLRIAREVLRDCGTGDVEPFSANLGHPDRASSSAATP